MLKIIRLIAAVIALTLTGCTQFGVSGYGQELKPTDTPNRYLATIYYGALTPYEEQSRPTAVKKADDFIAAHPEYTSYYFIDPPRSQFFPSAWVYTIHFENDEPAIGQNPPAAAPVF